MPKYLARWSRGGTEHLLATLICIMLQIEPSSISIIIIIINLKYIPDWSPFTSINLNYGIPDWGPFTSSNMNFVTDWGPFTSINLNYVSEWSNYHVYKLALVFGLPCSELGLCEHFEQFTRCEGDKCLQVDGEKYKLVFCFPRYSWCIGRHLSMYLRLSNNLHSILVSVLCKKMKQYCLKFYATGQLWIQVESHGMVEPIAGGRVIFFKFRIRFFFYTYNLLQAFSPKASVENSSAQWAIFIG